MDREWWQVMVRANSTCSPILAQAYVRNADRPVAYIDESFRGPQEAGLRFYILTAVVVLPKERDILREGIEEIAGQNYWHTSSELQDSSGRERTVAMLEYLGSGNEVSVVSLNTSIDANDRDLESARRECMAQLLPSLELGTETRPGTKLAIAERRRDRKQQNRDEQTHTNLVGSGLITRAFRLMQTSPADEHLLWLPDLVSSAVRRKVVSGKMDLVRPIEKQIEWL